MKIYTKIGDKGSTHLFSGDLVSKSDPLVKSYGKIDTLISFLSFSKSLLLTKIKNLKNKKNKDIKIFKKITSIIEDLQIICFEISTDLSSTRLKERQDKTYKPRVNQETLEKIEKYIDDLWENLPKLRNFILPGQETISSSLHIARSICREIEPILVECQEKYDINPIIMPIINRISDLLFTLALKAELMINKKITLLKDNKKIKNR